MKVHLGVLFICIIIKFNHAKEDDIEKEHIERFGSTILEKFDEKILTNASNVSSGHFRIRTRRQLKGGRCRGCGFANIPRGPRPSIIKGDDVRPPYKYPWTVAIKTEGKISCTGSIINEYFILTAAHCFKRDLYKYETLKPTGRKVPYLRPSEVSIEILKRAGPPVRRIIPHIRFTVSKWRNDIALLQLKRRIVCNRFTRPICLPPRNIVIPSQAILRIAGFGSDLGQGEAIDHLKEAKVRMVDIDTCSYSSHLKDGNYYCVNSARRDQTICYGDSGGPMVYRLGNKFYQIGVASMGKQCDVDEPFLYTSVPMHLNWIYKSMRHFRGRVSSGKVIRGRVHSDTEADDAVPFNPDSGEAEDSGEAGDSGEAVVYGEAVDYEGASVPEETGVPEGAGVNEGACVPEGAGVHKGAGIPEGAGVHEGSVSEVRLEAVGSGMADRGDNDGNYGPSKLSRPKKCVSNT